MEPCNGVQFYMNKQNALSWKHQNANLYREP